MAKKKTAVTKTAVKNVSSKKAVGPIKNRRHAKLPATKMTKTQVIRYMAEQMDVPPKQVAAS